MSVIRDILATYKGPGRVVARRLAMGQREDRAIAILMAGCILVYVSYWPTLSRQAYLDGEDLEMLMTNALFSWVFLAPLILYVAAFLSHLGAKAIRGKGTGYGSRLALFWAILASAPLLLLHGLVAGFIGPSLQQQIVGFLWFAAFSWFWIAGFFAVHWGAQDAA